MIGINRNLKITALVFIAFLLGLLFPAGKGLLSTRSVSAESMPGTGQMEEMLSSKIFTCTISELAVHTNADRFHIRCNPPPPTPDSSISYFAAASTPDKIAHTNQLLVLANTAYALGKPINIWYETDPALNPAGCLTGDCRKIKALVLKP